MQWEFCPRAYKYAYIDKLPFIPTLPMKMGSRFHDFADTFMEILPYQDLETTPPEEVFWETARSIEVPKVIEKYAKNFVTFELNRYNGIARTYDNPVEIYQPVLLEDKIVVKNALRDYDVDVDMVGIIDRLDMLQDGTAAMIEYKTSDAIREDNNNAKYRVMKELAFYTILLEKSNQYLGTTYPKVSHWVVYSPITDYAIIELTNSRTVNTVLDRLIKMYQDVSRGFFPHKENLFCSTCLGAEVCLESDISREEILELCSGAAYNEKELGDILDTRPSTIRGILSDMELEGLVKRAYRGKTAYWWKE